MPYRYDANNYDPAAEYERELIPVGDYICKVEKARWNDTPTRNGDEWFTLELAVKGFRAKLWYSVVAKCATPEEQKRTDQWIGSVFAAFGISPTPDVQVTPLIGKVGAVHVKHETRDDETYARAAYLHKRDKAVALYRAQQAAAAAQNELPVDQPQNQAQPTSYRTAAARTTGPGGAPGFDRYGNAYPPAQDVRLDENDNFVPAEEADIPF